MTTSRDPHIVSSFDAQLGILHDGVAQLGEQVERQFASALRALADRDAHVAARVIASDSAADALQRMIEEQTVRVLALRSPVADDLRIVVASIKVAGELERIGDLASNIAKRSLVLNQFRPVLPLTGVLRMGEQVQERIRMAVEAHVAEDATAAYEVWAGDEEIDQLHTALFREILTYMIEDPRTITACTQMMFVAKNIERCGDHATNIAEMTHYLVRGEPLAEQRPKNDLSVLGDGTAEWPAQN